MLFVFLFGNFVGNGAEKEYKFKLPIMCDYLSIHQIIYVFQQMKVSGGLNESRLLDALEDGLIRETKYLPNLKCLAGRKVRIANKCVFKKLNCRVYGLLFTTEL